jgi:hypothetical protein
MPPEKIYWCDRIDIFTQEVTQKCFGCRNVNELDRLKKKLNSSDTLYFYYQHTEENENAATN